MPEPACTICGQRSPHSPCDRSREIPPAFDELRAAALFEGPVREAVHRLKYGNLTAAAPALAELLIAVWQRHHWDDDCIIPVPLHPARQRQRGYNQSAELAKALSVTQKLPLYLTALQRLRAGRDQIDLTVVERRTNVHSAFAVRHMEYVTGRHCVVIDDVATTGSTLNECARMLKAAGATKVYALVLARQLIEESPN